MKKLVVGTLVAALSLSLASFSVASICKHKYRSQPLGVSGVTTTVPTDIIVTNYARTNIQFSIPNSAVRETVYPSQYWHIFDDRFYGDTHLVLQDPMYRTIFDGYVCRYARVTVSGGTYRYNVNIDSSYC